MMQSLTAFVFTVKRKRKEKFVVRLSISKNASIMMIMTKIQQQPTANIPPLGYSTKSSVKNNVKLPVYTFLNLLSFF